MPQQTPLRTGDPKRVGRYRLAGRIAGIPADDPIYVGISPDGVEVAISMLRTDWAQDAAARDRFTAEAAVAKRVPPFCAARVLDAGLEGQDAYLVSEYVPGHSLLEVVAADGPMAGPELEAIAVGMATGLASVHQAGLVHGNFGPEYVIIASDRAPRVIEFGITPPYGTATPAADMLAWAQSVVFAATGRPPASRSDVTALPGRLSAVAAQCLDPDPAERPLARSVVLNLLGNVALPAGVLAEGMRRATWAAGYAPGEFEPPRHRHSAAGLGAPRSSLPHPGPSRPGQDRPGATSTGQRHHAPQRDGRGRRTGLLAGAAVVVVVLIAAGVVHLLQGSGSPGSAATIGATSSRSTGASHSPSADCLRRHLVGNRAPAAHWHLPRQRLPQGALRPGHGELFRHWPRLLRRPDSPACDPYQNDLGPERHRGLLLERQCDDLRDRSRRGVVQLQ